MKTIKSKSLDENRVAWTGYDLGALLSSRVQSVTVTRSGDTVATLADGMQFNCHPLVFRCGTPDKIEGNKRIPSQDVIEITEGVYPIRFEII